MVARLTPLLGDGLDDLPARCRACLFWECGERPSPTQVEEAATTPGSSDARVRKQAWVTAQSLETGPPGVLLRQGGQTVGYVLCAPPTAFAARTDGVPYPSHDALLLATAWLDPAARAAGHGAVVVQAAIKEALRLGLAAVEAYGDRRAREWDCVLPATWLLHEGFEVAREHPRYPLLRLETHRVVRWAESLEHAVEGLLERAARPRTAPGTVTPGA